MTEPTVKVGWDVPPAQPFDGFAVRQHHWLEVFSSGKRIGSVVASEDGKGQPFVGHSILTGTYSQCDTIAEAVKWIGQVDEASRRLDAAREEYETIRGSRYLS